MRRIFMWVAIDIKDRVGNKYIIKSTQKILKNL